MHGHGSARFGPIAGILTWLAVGAPVLIDAARRPDLLSDPRILGWLGAWLVFGAAFAAHSFDPRARSARPGIVLLAVMSLSALAANALIPMPLPGVAIVGALLVMVAASLLPALSARAAILWVLAQSAALLAIYAAQWPWPPALVAAGAYAGFQLFAVMTAAIAQRESVARRELAAANVGLRAARAEHERHVQVAERERIWRELHDVLGHHLAALSLNLEAAAALSEGRSAEAVGRSRALARLLLADIRSVMSESRRADTMDLGDALAALGEGLPGLEVRLTVDPAAARSGAAAGHALHRCAQEFLTNTLRHAAATRVDLSLERWGDEIILRARDNGRGCNPARLSGGRGVRGMRNRVEALGGSLMIQTAPGQGFSITAAVPDEAPPAGPEPGAAGSTPGSGSGAGA